MEMVLEKGLGAAQKVLQEAARECNKLIKMIAKRTTEMTNEVCLCQSVSRVFFFSSGFKIILKSLSLS